MDLSLRSRLRKKAKLVGGRPDDGDDGDLLAHFVCKEAPGAAFF
jgi:hypothetical protein